MITSYVTVAVTSNEGLQKEKYVNDAMTIVSLKSSCHANGRIPHQIPIVSSKIENMYSSTMTDALSSVNDVQESSSIKGKICVATIPKCSAKMINFCGISFCESIYISNNLQHLLPM